MSSPPSRNLSITDKKRKFYNGKIKCDYYMFTDNARKK